ncbi:DUF3578 domain-containing protein [Devosia sp. SD17-2]|uniref:MrcB family domain-containing protein n=1 Tax=Devosia sp. SD17-2 TaxID=2976459 RepID=UPI0023D806CD|nr:DUF3578 domain-containing protein [Devosia sp. SD17-2]WEJ31629.1 DUF3578 domain-containing protein [Devosia sp. SD17-2]
MTIAELINNVLENYIALAYGKNKKGERKANQVKPGKNKAMLSIRKELPAALKTLAVSHSKVGADAYKFVGDLGQNNFTFAEVPWVACRRLMVSDSVQRGYFIVLLFKPDMSGVYLTLNQGYQQYFDTYSDDEIAQARTSIAAAEMASSIELPTGFSRGAINLGSKNSRPKGYQAGSIFSKYYPATDDFLEMAKDFVELLTAYERLVHLLGPLVLNNQEFQNAANEIAGEGASPIAPPPGPVDRPEKKQVSASAGWRRNASMAAVAIRNAKFSCEVAPEHMTFKCQASGENFVEAHHLIPMHDQANHPHSIDVPENIVALCPNCHRCIHHASHAERWVLAHTLLTQRTGQLKSRGIDVDWDRLKKLYRIEISEAS